ncbi:uncharacterized protein [Choristoneura fumiferana]|uniref:uncharacterized protein n=1 Tax=Choristoneura fumiferana TaxID=7141 RepID=UPI003D1589E7
MKVLVLITIFTILHHTTATLETIHELKKTAKTKLQSLHDAAASEIQKLVDNIDPEKVKKLDVFNVIPKVTKLVMLFEGVDDKPEPLIFDPYQGERLSHYFEQKHGYRGKRLVSALGKGLPLPMLKRMDAV